MQSTGNLCHKVWKGNDIINSCLLLFRYLSIYFELNWASFRVCKWHLSYLLGLLLFVPRRNAERGHRNAGVRACVRASVRASVRNLVSALTPTNLNGFWSNSYCMLLLRRPWTEFEIQRQRIIFVGVVALFIVKNVRPKPRKRSHAYKPQRILIKFILYVTITKTLDKFEIQRQRIIFVGVMAILWSKPHGGGHAATRSNLVQFLQQWKYHFTDCHENCTVDRASHAEQL